MANVFSMADIKNRPSRNGFDLSRKNLFTAKVGEYLPVCAIECLPGDVHTIKSKWMTRTQPLNTAAYTRIKEYYDWYFVPYNLLWNKFNDFVTNMVGNNLKASGIAENQNLTDQHPYATTHQIWNYVYTQAQADRKNFFGYSRAELTVKLLEYLGYGDYSQALISQSIPITFTNRVVNLWNLLAYQKIYQDHLRNTQWEKAYAPACNINYMTGYNGELNIPLQDIDYEVSNMFDLRYADWNKDYFMGVLPNSQYGDAASIMMTDLLNFTETDSAINIYSTATTTGNATWVSASQGGTRLSNGATTALNLKSGSIREIAESMGLTNESLRSHFSILALRQAEAVQKMREVMQSHEQDYKSQVEARWNVKVNDALSDRCKWLGGDSSNLDISEVVNTNLPEDVSGLPSTYKYDANIKGKGVGIGDGFVKCNTELYGVLMCVYHAVPVLDFAIDGIKKANSKTLFTDYAQPELDKTGMVSVPLQELTSKFIPELDGLLGYAPQYYEYKSAYDECHGGFNSSTAPLSLKSWVAPIGNEYIQAYLDNISTTGFNTLLTYYFFKVPPAILDDIMAVKVDSTISTDQLLVNSYFDIKSVRNLDYNGLPY